ncbi:rhodanese-like domain-containing protein [bacterium]|jgi:rhodanese-related sulfurtransferase|nr:rhodanese-like domain-containing protein [bacterium]MBT4251150.1 rhodanese-like domain-containing protein [bacterium]MBT4598058.1 rhodanese-like domain-containing protein [bacterium]MBT6753401.1 rhodanese-like domain-containing protein [bacterium]MBT7038114.1 rhodanese-like domain-containing protein [bacterium]
MQHQPPRKQIISQESKKTQPFLIWPALVAFILIVTISGVFYVKKINKQKGALEKKLSENKQVEADANLQVPTISPKETSRAIRNEDFQLVDIREENEFILKHIEASINIPLTKLEDKLNLLSKTKTIIIIDRTDSPNGRILTEHLQKEGLTVKYLDGGIINYAHNEFGLVTLGNPLIQSDLLKVTSYTAKEIIEQLLDGSRLKFIDTRSAVDFALDHIDGSINIPLEELEKKKDKLPVRSFIVLDKDPIRSFQAAVRLYDMNVLGVYNCKDTYNDMKDTIANIGKEEPADK